MGSQELTILSMGAKDPRRASGCTTDTENFLDSKLCDQKRKGHNMNFAAPFSTSIVFQPNTILRAYASEKCCNCVGVHGSRNSQIKVFVNMPSMPCPSKYQIILHLPNPPKNSKNQLSCISARQSVVGLEWWAPKRRDS